MAFVVRRRQVAMKLEAVFGTYNAPAAVDIITPVFDLEYDAEVEMFEREIIRESLSPIAQIPGERSSTISFSTELKGSGVVGTPPQHLQVPLRSCGMLETIVPVTSVTYTLRSLGHESASIEIRETDDTGPVARKRMAGGRGNVTITAEKGQPVILAFEFTGKYLEPDELAGALAPSPSIGLQPLPFLGVAFTFQGIANLLVQQVEVDAGNEVSLRNDINDPSGNIGGQIVSRMPTFSINPEQPLLSVYNPWDQWTDGDEGVMSYTLGATPGNICTLSAPKAQITDVGDGDRDSIRTNEIEGQLNGSTVAGDDELSLAFT